MPIGIEEYISLFASVALLIVSVVFFILFYRKPAVYCKLFGRFRTAMKLFIISFGLYLAVEVLEAIENPTLDALLDITEDYIQIAAFLIWIAVFSYFMVKSKGE